MRRWLPVFLLVLAACQQMLPGNPIGRSPRVDAFKLGNECAHVCWLGINPGVTSSEQAVALLMVSNEIDRGKFFKRTDTAVQTIWKPDKSNLYSTNVWVNFDGHLVRSINFGSLAPFSMKDMIVMLGEPDKIAIRVDQTIDGGPIVTYGTYWSSLLATVYVYPGSADGPNPEDSVDSLVLNSGFALPKAFKEIPEQAWLGYGHLKEYLPGQELPAVP